MRGSGSELVNAIADQCRDGAHSEEEDTQSRASCVGVPHKEAGMFCGLNSRRDDSQALDESVAGLECSLPGFRIPEFRIARPELPSTV